ncbi:MAG: hypothetical protein RLZZ94_1224 [Bacteroidota bacterium]
METTATKGKRSKPKYSKDLYLQWYEQMQLMRRFEERAGQLYGMQDFATYTTDKKLLWQELFLL